MGTKTKYVFFIIIYNIAGAQRSALSLPDDSAAWESPGITALDSEIVKLSPSTQGLRALVLPGNLLEMQYLRVHLRSTEYESFKLRFL